ncbi:glycosyltransferase [Methanohalophilus profundi]|uniref:glycosyltransferase n=1 Tax=Methanohalophilus profundi TaxID=2138083 RepID=UPI00101DFD64|nr:glycosyltransferase [Methanohalophilus profundi]
MNTSHKIALVLPYLKSRGTERQGLAIAENLRAKGWSVSIIVIEEKGDYFEVLKQNNFEYYIVNPKTRQKSIYLWRKIWNTITFKTIRKVVRYIKQNEIDLIYSRAFLGNKITILSAFFSGIPSVIFISGQILPEPQIQRNPFNYCYKKIKAKFNFGSAPWLICILRLKSKIVCVSHTGGERLKKKLPLCDSKIKIVQNGVNIEKLQSLSTKPIDLKGINSNSFNILYCGSLDEYRKGLDILLLAYSNFLKEPRDISSQLIIVGTGKDENKLKEKVLSLGISDYVNFVGEQHNPYPFFKVSSVFILPSRREGFPNVLLEAMALKLSCISTNCDTGPSELISNKENGILVPVEDSDSITEALHELYLNSNLRISLGEKAYQTVLNDFRFEDKAKKIEEIFQNSIEYKNI